MFEQKSGKLRIRKWRLQVTSTVGKFLFKTPDGVAQINYSEEDSGQSRATIDNPADGMVNVSIKIMCPIWRRQQLFNWIKKVSERQYVRCVYTQSDGVGPTRLFKARDLHMPNFYVIDAQLKQQIDTCIDNFLSARQWYADNDVPYRLSFMLHGIPGSGKTTIADYIAMRFNSSTLYVTSNLRSVTSNITDVRNRVPDGVLPLVLIDDVDALFGGLKRDPHGEPLIPRSDTGDRALAILLSLLDSTIAPDNCVIVMTTNHIESIDPALLRPGRFSMTLEVGYMQDATVRSIFEKSYRTPMVCDHVFTHVRACEVGDIYKQNLNNPNRFIELITATDIANKKKESENV